MNNTHGEGVAACKSGELQPQASAPGRWQSDRYEWTSDKAQLCRSKDINYSETCQGITSEHSVSDALHFGLFPVDTPA